MVRPCRVPEAGTDTEGNPGTAVLGWHGHLGPSQDGRGSETLQLPPPACLPEGHQPPASFPSAVNVACED